MIDLNEKFNLEYDIIKDKYYLTNKDDYTLETFYGDYALSERLLEEDTNYGDVISFINEVYE